MAMNSGIFFLTESLIPAHKQNARLPSFSTVFKVLRQAITGQVAAAGREVIQFTPA
ncbi:hypothetical protein KP190043_p12450 (plasmid) [Klebsiella pneumoniae subsp. pneumoniae]